MHKKKLRQTRIEPMAWACDRFCAPLLSSVESPTRLRENKVEIALIVTSDGRVGRKIFVFWFLFYARARHKVRFSKPMNEQIVILDFGSQYTQVIARRIRECNVYSTILRLDTPAKQIAALKPKGLILSGGPSSVYADEA